MDSQFQESLAKEAKVESQCQKPLEKSAKVESQFSLNNHWKHKQKWMGSFEKVLEKTMKLGVSVSKTIEQQRKNVGRDVWRAVWEQSGDICVETIQSGANFSPPGGPHF